MMGGATENDDAMTWLLERATGGNILVIRASGSDGYQNYLYSELGVNVASVETIVFNNDDASYSSFVQERIARAEMIWIAGGDQWDYTTYWQSSPVKQLLNDHVNVKQAPIGGTSAGMAILGQAYFSAENGTVTSQEALQDPYREDVTVRYDDFLEIPYLENVITDSHYDDPDRRGRHSTFIARLYTDEGISARGIACNEYTAVCIDGSGIARVFGEYPDYEEHAYFIQVNCEVDSPGPEVCESGMPLSWWHEGTALKVYKAPGRYDASSTFDLNDWTTAHGGEWQDWSIINGNFYTTEALVSDCWTDIIEYNNTCSNTLNMIDWWSQIETGEFDCQSIFVYSMDGRSILSDCTAVRDQLDCLSNGIYLLQATGVRDGCTISTRILHQR